MRITGGAFGGRSLLVPKTLDVRPTQDRVREALFSMLMSEVPGAAFLDLFAGSGAVGLEALSRGAAAVTFVESNPRHLDTIRRNLAAFGASATVVRADAYAYIGRYDGAPFDLVFVDPPYALGASRGYEAVLGTLTARGVVRPGGAFIAEMTAAQPPASVSGWELARDRAYGRTRLCLWRRVLL